ncbi:MAG: acetyl-lysine deacetylase [Chloroflexi bacterium HGW-Chloroflexi-3]|nr:MAG: acetyl-lysine deacetylase [Chloroflexi bacterium HGW-Chloroflexi-3]
MIEIPETLLGLLHHYSPSDSESAAVNWLVQRMTALQFEQSFMDEVGNAIGIKGSGFHQIILLGHIDTVKGEIPVRLEGDNLFGRGSVDAKGPLASFVDAVAAIPVAPDWQVVVIGAVDEEGDSKGAKAIIDQYQPQFAIIGEPSQWNRVTLGYKGSQQAALTCRQPITHSSQGGNANDVLLLEWQSLLQRVKVFNQDKTMFEQIIPTVLNMSSTTDGFDMVAKIKTGVRLPVSISPQTWLKDWLGALIGAKIKTPPTGIPAHQADKNSVLTRAFLGAIRQAGGKPGFVNKSGTSDLNLVAPVWQCPAVAFGPGDSNLDHTPDEHISIADYEKAIMVLVSVFKNLGISS